ncbi:MAG: hypothetical protein E7399_07820 [Ruminococcaceae bacterium]|nr:hypothetical protein [Oscillospiraceae bacterium]
MKRVLSHIVLWILVLLPVWLPLTSIICTEELVRDRIKSFFLPCTTLKLDFSAEEIEEIVISGDLEKPLTNADVEENKSAYHYTDKKKIIKITKYFDKLWVTKSSSNDFATRSPSVIKVVFEFKDSARRVSLSILDSEFIKHDNNIYRCRTMNFIMGADIEKGIRKLLY